MTAALAGHPVDAVLFDYGGTLVTFARPHAALRSAYHEIELRLRAAGFRPPPAGHLLRDVHDRVEAELAAHQRSGNLEEIDLVAAARRAYADLGLAVDDSTLDTVLRLEQEAWWRGVRVDPDAIPTLDALRRHGVRVGLCSNAAFRVRSLHDQVAHFGLAEHLNSVTFSAEIGWRKPAPQMFTAAAARLDAEIARTIMVGDSARDDIEGARALGMRALWLQRATPPNSGSSGRGATAVITRLSDVASLLLGP